MQVNEMLPRINSPRYFELDIKVIRVVDVVASYTLSEAIFQIVIMFAIVSLQ